MSDNYKCTLCRTPLLGHMISMMLKIWMKSLNLVIQMEFTFIHSVIQIRQCWINTSKRKNGNLEGLLVKNNITEWSHLTPKNKWIWNHSQIPLESSKPLFLTQVTPEVCSGGRDWWFWKCTCSGLFFTAGRSKHDTVLAFSQKMTAF